MRNPEITPPTVPEKRHGNELKIHQTEIPSKSPDIRKYTGRPSACDDVFAASWGRQLKRAHVTTEFVFFERSIFLNDRIP